MKPRLGFLILLAACRPDSSSPRPVDDPALGQLQRETGHLWQVRYDPVLHTAASLLGRTAPLALSPLAAEHAARAFVLDHPALFGLDPELDELATQSAETDELGMIHVHFGQRRRNLPVWRAELRVHFASDGALVRVNGRAVPLQAITLIPDQSATSAQSAALGDAAAQRPDVDPEALLAGTPELGLWWQSPGVALLAWRTGIEVPDSVRPMQLAITVDAINGHVLHRTDLLAHVDGSGAGVFGERRALTVTEKRDEFWLEDPSRGMQRTFSAAGGARLPGSEVHSRDATVWDRDGVGAGAAVDAHAFAATVWDHFMDVHGRAGWDGQGHGVRSVVHFGRQLRGAFFDGRQLVFGDGDATMAPAAAAFDIVAHEFAHGVVAATAGLTLEGETGALHEGMADAFACFASIAARTGGEWTIGEALGPPLRDLSDPHATGQPARLDEWVATDDDAGGIHANATIAGHAAFLVAQALGPATAEQVWYRALTRYLTASARLVDGAEATMAAADDLSADAAAVRQAWVATGVLDE